MIIVWMFFGIATVFTIILFTVAALRPDSFGDWAIGWLIPAWIACFIAIMSLIGGIAGTADSITCRNSAHNIGVEYRWSLSAGCFYRLGNHWIPEDQWRAFTKEHR